MDDFRKVPVYEGENLLGRTISRVRATEDDGLPRRLVLIFDDGSTLSFDGRFPSNAILADASEVAVLEGRRFDGMTCGRKERGKPTQDGRYEQDLTMRVTSDGEEFEFLWHTVGHDNFDVTPEPRISVRLQAH